MLIQKLRLQRGWSQEQLAEFSGLSTRTIQRIERGQKPSLESLKSLASVFEIDFSTFNPDPAMDTLNPSATSPAITSTGIPNIDISGMASATQHTLSKGVSAEELWAFARVRKIKGFWMHALVYVLVISVLAAWNLYATPGRLWFLFTALGWGGGLLAHAVSVFLAQRLFSADWEKRQVEKILKRPL